MKRRSTRFVLLAMMAATVLVAVPIGPASAAVITVDTLADDGGPGDCELREAITAANTNSAVDTCAAGVAGMDTIRFSVAGTITLQTGELLIAESLNIDGPGAGALTVDGNASDRVFRLDDGSAAAIDVRMRGIAVTNGSAGLGGGIHAGLESLLLRRVLVTRNTAQSGGGIYANGPVRLDNTRVTGNMATTFGGGGIYISGRLDITGSEISGNMAPSGGGIEHRGPGAIDTTEILENEATTGVGGGIWNTGDLRLERVRLIGNSSFDNGGGMRNDTILVIRDSVFRENEAGEHGGGLSTGQRGDVRIDGSRFLANEGAGFGGGVHVGAGGVVVRTSTFTGNNADDGGAIANIEGDLTLWSSTLNRNEAFADFGGGVYNVSGTTRVRNSTISGNTSGDSGGGVFNFEGDVVISFSTIVMNDSDAADNIGSEDGRLRIGASIVALPAAGNPNCSVASIVSDGFNVSDDDSCGFTGPGDIEDVDPVLGPLALNPPGSTKTHALLTGSPALERVPLAACTVAMDQRGVTRPQGPNCDSGAYEAELGSITIVKSASRESDQVFAFEIDRGGGPARFELSDGGAEPDSRTFDDLLPQRYTVRELVGELPADWEFDRADCRSRNGTSTINVAGPRAAVDLGLGDHVECIFRNKFRGLDIEKFTNGHDADQMPGPTFLVGEPLTWKYVVTNDGDVPITGIAVTDDKLGPIACPKTALDPGEQMVCTANGFVMPGPYKNVGTVTGFRGGAVFTDSDPSHYFGELGDFDLKIVKRGPRFAAPNSTVTYEYFVWNQLPGTSVPATVVDDGCDDVQYHSGDWNGDGLVNFAEAWKFTCDYFVDSPPFTMIVNIATVLPLEGDFDPDDNQAWWFMPVVPWAGGWW